jgi:leader peptidase (prepilin peptidase)/N-methyltransferase
MEILFAAFLGLVQGSFFATIVLRAMEAHPAKSTRSRCDACGRQLRWFELIPLFSWIGLRGHCRTCGSRIALAHPLLEAGSMAVWVAAVWFADGDLLVRFGWGFLASATLALLWSDFAAQLVPDPIVFAIALAGVARAAALDTLIEQVATGLFAGSLLALVRWAFLRLRGRETLGLGDVKLFAALGLWLQPHLVGPSLLIGSIATLAVALALRLHSRREIPFAPGLLLGAWITFIFT